MALNIREDGWSATEDHAALIEQMRTTVQFHKGELRDILLGMLYDEWQDRFDEEVPDRVRKFIERAKRATLK